MAFNKLVLSVILITKIIVHLFEDEQIKTILSICQIDFLLFLLFLLHLLLLFLDHQLDLILNTFFKKLFSSLFIPDNRFLQIQLLEFIKLILLNLTIFECF